MDCFLSVNLICIRDKNHQMSFKKYKPSDFINLCLLYATLSFSIFFCNVKNNHNCLHMPNIKAFIHYHLLH